MKALKLNTIKSFTLIKLLIIVGIIGNIGFINPSNANPNPNPNPNIDSHREAILDLDKAIYSLPSSFGFGGSNSTINPECDLVGVKLYLHKNLLQDKINGEQAYFQNINVEEFNCHESIIDDIQERLIKMVELSSTYGHEIEVCAIYEGLETCEDLKTGKRTTTKIEEDSWFNWSW